MFEWGALVHLRALGGRDLSFGGGLAAGIRLLHASGQTADARTGTALRAVPVLGADLCLRVAVIEGLQIELGGAAELSLQRQYFALDGVRLLDAGILRLAASLAFIVTID